MHVPSQDLDFQCHISWSFLCVQWVVVRSRDINDCWFCWCWCNCWPSLLKRSFHNIKYTTPYKLLLNGGSWKCPFKCKKHDFLLTWWLHVCPIIRASCVFSFSITTSGWPLSEELYTSAEKLAPILYPAWGSLED